jgi:hypothetical protein
MFAPLAPGDCSDSSEGAARHPRGRGARGFSFREREAVSTCVPAVVQSRCERSDPEVLCAVCRWQDDPAVDRWWWSPSDPIRLVPKALLW